MTPIMTRTGQRLQQRLQVGTTTLVLIPTARLVDKEMQLEVGAIPPVLIPLNNKPLFELIIERYKDLPGGATFLVVAREGIEMIRDYLDLRRAPDNVRIHVVEVPSVQELGDTITYALESVDLSSFERLIINFGDTLLDSIAPDSSDVVYYEVLNESYRWTTFTHLNGRMEITDRFAEESGEAHNVFTGVFALVAPGRFLESLHASSRKFYPALSSYLADRPYSLALSHGWNDFGHVDNYCQSKKKFINKRFFNEMEIDLRRAIIKKKSKNVEKFLGEIRWYLELPAALRCFVPQIFEYSLETQNPFVEMEYYGYPTVADLYLSSGYELGIWNHVFEAIFGVMKEMRKFRYEAEPSSIRENLTEMYLTKTLARLDKIRSHPVLSRFFVEPLIINGREYKPLQSYLELLEPLLDQTVLNTTPSLTIIHGDLCLSNILFDPRSRIVKLIDPRGKFGQYSLYGDHRYELAKLAHSFNGHYESIIHDRFFTICDDNQITYQLTISKYQQRVGNMFNRRLGKEYGRDIAAVEIIESLLFLSMIPLHGDHLNRQIMMLATGIEKIDSAVAANLQTIEITSERHHYHGG